MAEQGEATMPRVGGRRFYCDCGCGVFTRFPSRPSRYECNGCDHVYEGVPLPEKEG